MKTHTSLFILIFISQLLLITEVPLWTGFTTVAFWIWRLISQYNQIQAPRWLTGLFSIVFLIVTLLWYKTAFDKDVATTYLLILSSLKILEYKDETEINFIVLLGLFLAVSKFLFTFDLIFTFTGLFLIIAYLFQLLPTSWNQKKISFRIWYLTRIILFSIPTTLVLFFIFPRIQTAGFGLYGTTTAGQSGFSDDLKPGSISEVIKSNEVAFRAEFYNTAPKPESLYWRGQVLTEIENFHWRRSSSNALTKSDSFSNQPYDYKIVLEPHYNKWLFSFDPSESLSISNSQNLQILKLTQKNVFVSFESIQNRVSYQGHIGKVLTSELSVSEFKFSKDIEKYENDIEIQSLLKSLKATTHQETVNKILNYYAKSGFQYTLTPGQQDQMIQPERLLKHFLFQSKKGFCEYYASATAILLQLLKIPSQVVIGYQGGEYNENGNFYSIKQKDAHAWVEYLSEDNVWVRLDPTQVVAPDRLSIGAVEFEKKYNQSASLFVKLKNLITDNNTINEISNYISFVNYKWNMFLLDFDRDQQNEILELIKKLFVQIVIALFAITLLLIVYQIYKRRRVFDRNKDKMAYLFEKRMSDLGLSRLPNEGPLEWKNRLINTSDTNTNDTSTSENLNTEFKSIFNNFIELYFSNTKDLTKHELNQFKIQLKKLKK